MRITESQLRRIIRQEVRSLHEGLSARDRGQVLRSFAYGQLKQHAPAELERLETEAPEAYEQFLSNLYAGADPASGEGLDGRGFLPHLRAALRAAGLDDSASAAEQELEDLYDTVADPHDEHTITSDVQGTSRMMVSGLVTPGEEEVLKIIARMPDPAHQDALLSAMARRTGASEEDLRGLMHARPRRRR